MVVKPISSDVAVAAVAGSISGAFEMLQIAGLAGVEEGLVNLKGHDHCRESLSLVLKRIIIIAIVICWLLIVLIIMFLRCSTYLFTYKYCS